MGTLIQLVFQLVAIGFVSSQYSALLPTSIDQGCSSECVAGIPAGGATFEENVKYGYDFSGKTTLIAPTDDSKGISEVSITGKANIIGTPQCGAIIYLKNVEITYGSKTYADTKLEGYPILISYNNGRVGPTICTSEKDSAASMNLKRSIISALQVSSVQDSEILETDVQGTCNTSYSLSSTDSYNVITKNKNLIQCSGYGKISMLASNQNYEDSPFSEATQESKILLVQSMIRSVASKETFLFQPLGPMGLVTEIKTSMDLNLKKRGPIHAPSLNLERAQSIVFVKPASTIVSANKDQLVAATQLAMKSLEPIVEINGAKNYADLVELLKVANKDDILSAYQQVKSSSESDGNENADVAETLFIDALMAANSGQSIEAVVELIKNNKLSKPLTVSWFINLAKANHPTQEAVESASSLLNDKVIKEGYMGIGVLLRQYLKDTHNYESPEVTNTLKNLAAPLQKTLDSSLSPEDEEIAIASLKGLESVRYINSQVEDLIVKTIMNKGASQRIRAAALAMAKTYANYPKVEKACESIFTDTSEDSELRILAFKAYALYPSNNKAAVIKSVLDDKNCQLQIQSFLLSYLNNLKLTADESKLDQKSFYQGIKSVSSKKSLNDILRYSQNLEHYHHCPILRSGALLNRDLIYSYKSFLPRSYSASLRTLLFGRPQNVFDFDIRVENIEPMLEKLFGPEGRFAQSNDHPISDIGNYIIQAIKYAKQRGLNNIDSEKSYESGGENNSVEDMNKMYVDIALKVLGNDIGWFAFQGIESQITYQHIIDAILKHFDGSASALTNKQDIELNIRKHLQIIDFEKQYAACSGLPISMKIQSTAAIKLNMATNFDIQSYIKQPENSNFALKLIPSGTVNLNTFLTVNGYVVDVGHKVASTFHTSTGADLSVKTVSGHGFEIIYGLPLNVIDVLSLETGAFKVIQENGSPPSVEPIDTDVSKQSYSRTFDNLVNTTGLALNVEYNFPWDGSLQSVLPFSGPSKLSIKFLKVDENLTKYVMKGIYDFNSPTLKYIKLIFVTPKADISRGVELFVAYESQTNKKFIAQFRTPSTSIVLQSTLVNTDDQKTIEVQYTDGSEHDFSIGALCEKLDDDTIKYSPIFGAAYAEYSTDTKEKHPFVPVFDIEGSVIVKYTKCDDSSALSVRPSKVTLQDIAFVTPKSKHSLQGSVMVEDNEINAGASMTNGKINITVHGYLSGHYPIYKASGAFDMIKSKSGAVQERQLQVLDDGESEAYQPASKLFEWLYRINSLNMFTSHELHVQQPYKFITNNYVLWDDEKVDLNIDYLVENGELTIIGNASTSNLLDLRSYANITVLPRTPSSGLTILGHAEHTFISNPTDTGFTNVQYIQSKDKTGSSLEINSECASIIGVFHIIAEHQYVDDKLEFTLSYDVQNSKFLSMDLNAAPNEVNFDLHFDYPEYPYYNSYVIAHGRLEKENTYSFDTKLLWPGTQNLNYLNAVGKILLNEHQSQFRGEVDWPSANLENVQVLIDSISNSEVEGGNIATVRCMSGKQVLFSEKLKYTLSMNDGEYVVSGKSVPDGSKNYIPIDFLVQYKNYIDQTNKVGKEMTYKIVLQHDGQTIVHQKLLQITSHVLVYRQMHKINKDEQQISLDLEYDYTDYSHWYYSLKSKFVSPSVFHLLIHDDQNMLECDINVKVSNFSIDTGHALKIYTSEALSQAYELKWFLNDKQTALKYVHGQREIRGLMQYSLDSINGGHKCMFLGDLYLDYNTNPVSKSSILVDTHYSIGKGYDSLSTASDVRVYVPYFNDKEMSIKTDIQIFENSENLINAKLGLDIFPTSEQAIEILTSLNRDNQDNGVLYSAELQATSDGMALDYLIKDSIFVSSEKWGKYFEASFIDSDNIERPLQLQFELVPSGLTTKINILDIAVINVDSTFNVSDSLNSRSLITYNGIPYSVALKLTSYPTIMLILGWNDKSGSLEQLKVEGSITMDDSTVLSVTHIINDGEEATSVGSVKKSLERENWWETDNQIDSEQWNLVWKSLKREFIERFIMVNSNMKNIISVAKNQRKIRSREIKKAKPQLYLIKDYMNDELSEIFKEIIDDEYLSEIPMLTLNTTKATISDLSDFIKYMDAAGYESLSAYTGTYTKEMAHFYLEKTLSYFDLMYRGHVKLHSQLNYALTDLLNILNIYTNKPVNDLSSSEPHSLKDYLNDVIRKLIITIQELKVTLENLQDASDAYIKNLPIYDMFYDQIEKLKTYPYKDKLWEEIHKHLLELEETAPTKDFASFINALDKYIDAVIHDKPVDQRDLINLRNKTIIVVKSFIFDFSDYVSYDRGMSVYSALRKVNNIAKTILYIVAPNSFPYPSDDQSSFLDYRFLYKKYLNPSNLLPPFKAQGVIVGSNNIITYNGQSYTIMPNTDSYILAKDYVNNKFSILANYNDNVLSSISVSTDNGNTYELLPGGIINANGENVALPFINENVKAWRDVYFFGIKVAVGIKIQCTMPLDIVQIFINGYYFGRIHGLLGSMNQEPMFDYNLPDGEKSTDMTSFVMAYRTTGNTIPTVISSVQTDQQPCPSLFSGVSSMKPIFEIVPPISYRAVCNQIVSTATSQQDAQDKACLVAKAYVSMAKENYVPSCSIPDMCITSLVNDKTVSTRSTVQISAPSDMADVMILIEEVAKDQQALSNLLKLFMDRIVKNFNYKQIEDVNFIVVGYSENSGDSNVHIYTADKDSDYNDILKNMPEWSSLLPPPPSPSSISAQIPEDYVKYAENNRIVQSLKKVVGENAKDKVYKLSVDYPYRPNAIKTVVSVVRSLYDQSSPDVSVYTFDYVASAYESLGIKFNLVAPINLSYPSDTEIFGASGLNVIYSMSDPKGKKIDDEFTFDKSLETNLVLKTNGAMYDSKFFTDGTGSHQNYFLRSLCRTIVYNAIKSSGSLKSCSASVHNGIMPYAVCTPVV